MAFPENNLILSETNTYRQKQEEIYEDYCNELKLLAGDEPKILIRKESSHIEKQISVDPISLRGSSAREASFNLMLPPPPLISPPRDSVVPLPLSSRSVPTQPKFFSSTTAVPMTSSPSSSSSSSSPRFSSILSKKKWKNESQASPRQVEKLSRKHSTTTKLQHDDDDSSRLQRSKSCGEGTENRPSSEDEFDFWLHNKKPDDSVEKDVRKKQNHPKTGDRRRRNGKNMGSLDDDDRFKCGSLCLYLPGFGKGKPVRPRKEPTNNSIVVRDNVISRTVSLEKFECGSWASSAIVHDEDGGESTNLYFDLPLEFIRRSGVNDAQMPVSTAFVFNKDVKGVLKTGSKCQGKQSGESPRHVRFSTSSPTSSCPASPGSCITPRLRRAREDFNAFLEAQAA